MWNNHGISYIETLVSAAILSLLLIPLVAGFRHTSYAHLRSEEIYIAALNCSNILLSAEHALKAGTSPSVGTLRDFLNADDFPEAYALEKFDYAVHISEINPDGSIEPAVTLTTGGIYAPPPDTALDIESLTLTAATDFENLISYDGSFDVSSCPFAEANGGLCEIYIPQGQPYTVINFDARRLNSPVTVSVENRSFEALTLNIFIQEDKQDMINLKYIGETDGVAVSFRELYVGESYLVTSEVYQKDRRLINRMAKMF